MRGLNGRAVIVTGGAASIGRAITEAFHAAGARVMIAARSREKGAALAARLGTNALFEQTDISDDAQLQRLIERTVEAFGRLDFIVNNACSYADDGRMSTRAQWHETLGVNLVSAARLVELAHPQLAQHRGAVVNIASISAYAAQTGRWTYPVSKAALLHLTRLQAMDYASLGIRVNALVAGWTESDPIESLSGGDWSKANQVAADFHLLGRLGRASEVAEGVLFLCSDHASFTTGGELKVEGGYLAMGPEQASPAIARLTGGRSTVA